MNAVAKVQEQEASPSPAPVAPAASADAAAPARERRPGKGRRTALMLSVPLLLALAGGYYWVTGGRFEETDNANVRQAKVSIAAETPGRIVEVNIAENQPVRAGDILFRIDPEPYRIALKQAEAALAAARLGVEQLRAAYQQALAEERVARDEMEYLRTQLERQSELARKGINARSALDEARRDLAKAEDEHQAALQGIASARAAMGGDPDIETDSHPNVLAALAARDQAALNLARTSVTAPADGIVSQAASFRVGQYVTAGTALFSLVETGDSWIEANFKETQLTHMQVGQEGEATIDAYPDRPLKVVVDSIGAGTGAEFSLLPAQNATGNWVKVTQRIPVRLKVEDAEAARLLRTGMSATVTVDTGRSRGLPALFGSAAASQ